MLFDNYERTDCSTKEAERESHYEYLNKSASPTISLIRQTLENWFSVYFATDPEEAIKLKSRLKDKDDYQHYRAFFELYLFILFKNLGFKVEIEPSLTTSSKKPDFLVTDPKTGNYFYLEATTVCEGDTNVQRENQISLIKNNINKKIKSSTYAINLYWYGSCTKSEFDKTKCITEIQEWIKNPETPYVKEFNQWVLKLEAVKINNPLEKIVEMDTNSKVQCLNKRTKIDLEGMVENRMDSIERIRQALDNKKASVYRDLKAPYIIAVNMLGIYFSDKENISLQEALLGKEKICSFSTPEGAETRCIRLPDGFWSEQKNQNVSGVFSFSNLRPNQIYEHMNIQTPALVANSTPTYPFEFKEIFELFDTHREKYEYIGNPKKFLSVLCLNEDDWEKAKQDDGWGKPYEDGLKNVLQDVFSDY